MVVAQKHLQKSTIIKGLECVVTSWKPFSKRKNTPKIRFKLILNSILIIS